MIREYVSRIPLDRGFSLYSVDYKNVFEIKESSNGIAKGLVSYIVLDEKLPDGYARYAVNIPFMEKVDCELLDKLFSDAMIDFKRIIEEKKSKTFDPNKGDVGLDN